MNRRLSMTLGIGLLAAASLAPLRGAAAGKAEPAEQVRSITLPDLPPELPPGPAAGRNTFAAVCTYCHSTQYIMNQPAFPRATWTNEVNKMRTTFGAPVGEAQVPEIVDYLMSFRGAPTSTTRP